MSDYTRISITIPKDVKARLDFVSTKTGYSRSSMINKLLANSLQDIEKIVSYLPENPTPDDYIAFKAFSNRLLMERVNAVGADNNETKD